MDELNQLTEGWVTAMCIIAAQACSTPGLKYPHAINLSLLQVFDYLNEELLLTMDSEFRHFYFTPQLSTVCAQSYAMN